MGQMMSEFIGDPATNPDYTKQGTFEPLYGFSEGRKERVMIATKEEMQSVALPLDKRDYCAHLAILTRDCRRKVWPWAYKCAHEKHEYLCCQRDDYVMRMKEYERERRLLERAKRKAAKEAREEMD